MLHDVGKIGIPDALLTKPRALLPEEMATVRRHCGLGYQLLTGSDSPLLNLAASIALNHHERWDGTGYPRGLAGDEIPIEGRIVAVADVFDAMTSARVYRPPIPMEEALATMGSESGRGFDPRLVDLFFESLSEFMEVRDQHPDGGFSGSQVRVLVVDDQELFAQGLLRLLDDSSGITVVGTVSSAKEAVRVAIEEEPDVVVLDWRLPDGTGADVARALLSARPSTTIVALTGIADDAFLAEAIDVGCSAVLTKARAFDEIIGVIHAAYAGEVTIALAKLSSIALRLRSPSEPAIGKLTSRELEILELLGDGLSNEAIAELLSLSPHTVRNHVQRIIMKMGAHSKLEAVTKALREGLIKVTPRFATL
jgi:response regulator RpfG family c-di-GMP phosphodiesterase